MTHKQESFALDVGQGKTPAGWKMVHDGCYVIAERECGELTEYFSSLTGETGNRKRKNTLTLCCVLQSDKNYLKR